MFVQVTMFTFLLPCPARMTPLPLPTPYELLLAWCAAWSEVGGLSRKMGLVSKDVEGERELLVAHLEDGMVCNLTKSIVLAKADRFPSQGAWP